LSAAKPSSCVYIHHSFVPRAQPPAVHLHFKRPNISIHIKLHWGQKFTTYKPSTEALNVPKSENTRYIQREKRLWWH
jgi:hypothetical protein